MPQAFDVKLDVSSRSECRTCNFLAVALSSIVHHLSSNQLLVALGLQVIASGRRNFFYVLDLGQARVERVHNLMHFDGQRSLESFAACASPANPLVAFLVRNAGRRVLLGPCCMVLEAGVARVCHIVHLISNSAAGLLS